MPPIWRLKKNTQWFWGFWCYLASLVGKCIIPGSKSLPQYHKLAKKKTPIIPWFGMCSCWAFRTQSHGPVNWPFISWQALNSTLKAGLVFQPWHPLQVMNSRSKFQVRQPLAWLAHWLVGWFIGWLLKCLVAKTYFLRSGSGSVFTSTAT